MPDITIHNLKTGEIEIRPMFQEEIDAFKDFVHSPFIEEPAPVEEAQPSTDAG